MMFVIIIILPSFTFGGSEALAVGFYDKTCIGAESTIRRVVEQQVAIEPRRAPQLLRLQFHDCFAEGCDASILLTAGDHNEMLVAGNVGVTGLGIIQLSKNVVESLCPGDSTLTLKSDIVPNRRTFLVLLMAHAQFKSPPEEAYMILKNMIVVWNIDPDIKHFGCIIDNHIKAGLLEHAFKEISNIAFPISDQICAMVFSYCTSIDYPPNFHTPIECVRYSNLKEVNTKLIHLSIAYWHTAA
ncbi:unnamed protein product [Cochlearia groenlandica]